MNQTGADARVNGADMNKLLLMPILMALTGCVSYYYPYGEPVEGVRYVPADEYVEHVYYEDEVVRGYDYSDIYVNSPYYPWWSIDYFYLGSHRSRSGLSIGFSYGSPHYWGGYSSYYDPFYPAYRYSPWSVHYSPFIYSAWYAPYYERPYRYFAGNSYFWRNRYDRHHGSGGHDRYRDGRHRGDRHDDNRSTLLPGRDHRLRDEDRFAVYDRDRNERRRRGEDGPGDDQRDPRRGGPGTDGLQRHTSVSSGTGLRDRGMEVRSRKDSKRSPSRMEPGKSVNARRQPDKPVVKLSPGTGKAFASGQDYKTARSDNSLVRYRSGSKDNRTQAKPVKPPGSRTAIVKPAPATRLSGYPSSQKSPVVTYQPPKADRRASRTVNTRKPVATINSRPARPAVLTRPQPAAPAVSAPAVRAQPQARVRTVPAMPSRPQKTVPRYEAPRTAKPAARPAKPVRNREADAGRSEAKGGQRRGSARK